MDSIPENYREEPSSDLRDQVKAFFLDCAERRRRELYGIKIVFHYRHDPLLPGFSGVILSKTNGDGIQVIVESMDKENAYAAVWGIVAENGMPHVMDGPLEILTRLHREYRIATGRY